MESVSDIARRARVNVLYLGALELVSARDAFAFLQAADAAGVQVIGIEGFPVENEVVMPDLDAIADYSDGLDPAVSIDAAKRFIEKVAQPDHWFEFTID
jgi:hypothetical protein